MPEISRFFGIVIAVYWHEHGVPHFHAGKVAESHGDYGEDGGPQ